MTIDPDIRLKIRNFFKKHGKLIIIIVFAIIVTSPAYVSNPAFPIAFTTFNSCGQTM